MHTFVSQNLTAMTKLSVNINKIATIRNARGGNLPDVLKAAMVSGCPRPETAGKD